MRFIYASVIAAMICFNGTQVLKAAINAREYLKRGEQALNESYNAQMALREFNAIIADQDTQREIKIQAYFWIAYSHLFEGNISKARLSFNQMFDFEKDPDFDYESTLDKTLKDNAELMRMFYVEFEEYHGRSRIVKDKNRKFSRHFAPRKSFFMRMSVILGIVGAVVVLTMI